MPVTLRNISDVSRVQEFRPEAAVRPKHRHADFAFNYVLPLISIGMPMQLPERAGFKFENDAGDGRRNWKARGIDAPFSVAFEDPVRRFRKHPKFVRLWRSSTRALQIFRYLFRWNRATGEVNLLAWKTVKR